MAQTDVQLTTIFDVNQAFPNSTAGAHDDNTDQNPETVRLIDGDFLVIWYSPGNTQLDPDRAPGTAFQRFNANGTPDGAGTLIANKVFDDVTALPDGGWVMANGTEWARFSALGVQIGGYGTVGTAPTQGVNAAIDTMADGGWVISWIHQVAFGDYDIYAQTFSAAGVAGAVTPINSDPAEIQEYPSVTAFADGTYAVSWTDGDLVSDLVLRIWHNGVESVIDEAGFVFDGEIAALSGGRMVVVYAVPDPTVTDLFYSFVEADGTVSQPFQMGTGGYDRNARVEVFPDGKFAIIWASNTPAPGTNFREVYVRVFASDGTPLDDAPIHVGTVPLGTDFSVTALDNTSFMVAWAPDDANALPPGDRTMNGAIYTILVGQDFVGTAGPDTFNGTNTGDTAYGLGGSDTLNGLDGDDLLDGGTGDDQLNGGLGSDTYYVDSQGDVITDTGGTFDRVLTSVSYTLATSLGVEYLSAADQLDTAPLTLIGNGGNQVIFGNEGANLLHGGGGADELFGLGGDDTYYTDVAATTVSEGIGDGNDVVYTSVSYALRSGQEIETLSTNNYAATAAINLTGNGLNQTLIGNAGNNVLHGGGGTDLLIGLGGNDTYYIDVAATQVIEAGGAGTDAIYTSVSYVLGTGEVETLSTNNYAVGTSINLTGNAFNQTLIGNAGANVLHGGGGVDNLIGLGGNDTYYVDVAGTQAYEAAGAGTDVIYTSVSYTLAAGSEIETLSSNDYGATTAINLTGNASAQTVVGNAGANTLNGGAGADTLYGLGGADNFAFTTALGGGNVDYIADFNTVADTVQLDDAIFAGIGTAGAFNPNAFFAGAAAHDADDRIIYNSATGQLFYDADGNGGGAAVQFATLAGNPVLTASDFQVI
jgi:Ca2+-binding RTX toxin-like protein